MHEAVSHQRVQRLHRCRTWSVTSPNKPVPDQQPHGPQSIRPADLFSLRESSRRITDGNLDDPVATSKDLGGHLWAEFKSLTLQVEISEHVGTKHLVASGFVGDMTPVECSREPAHQSTTPVVRRVGACISSEVSRPVHDSCAALRKRSNELQEILRVVFQVCILNYYQVSSDDRQCGANCRPLAAVPLVTQYPHAGVVDSFQDLPCAVCGTVVDDDNLSIERNCLDTLYDLPNRGAFIEARNHY